MVTWLDIDAIDAPRVALIDVTLEGLDEAGPADIGPGRSGRQ